MGIYKRGGKFYWYSFTYNGQRFQESTKQGDRKTATEMMAAMRTRLARIDAGLEAPKVEQKKFSVGELLSGLENDYKIRGILSSRTRSTLAAARGAFGTIFAGSLTSAQIDSYIEKQLAADYAPASVNRITETIRRAYRVAKHPAPEIRHLSERGNERKGFFSVQELEKVIENLPESLQDFTRFAFETAWRKGEVASLRWEDVEDGVIRLRGENSKNRQPRQVVIEGELTAIIERRRQARAVKTRSGVELAEFVFHRGGRVMQEFRKSWARACTAAGVGTMHCAKCDGEGHALRCPKCKLRTKYRGRIFHDLRRSGVRDMIRSGVPQSVAMKISGHRTASMFRRYDISSEADLREAMLNLQKYREQERQRVPSVARK